MNVTGRRFGRGARRLIAAAVAAVALGFAGGASALQVSVNLSLSAPYIEGLLTGQTQPLDTVGNLVCEPGQTVGGHLPGGQAVSALLCAIPALDYQYVTRFKTSGGGEIVRRHVALVNVPTPLNVDGDPVPDLVATVVVVRPSQFTLRINRALTEYSTLPVKVEAIVDDPTAGALPRDRINVGYDARASRAPGSWRVTATLPDDGSDALTTLNIAQDVTNAGATLTVVGGLFNGDSLNRRDPMGGSLRFTPVPVKADLGLTLGTHLEVRAGADTPTAVRADAEIVDGPREQRVGVDLDPLPQKLLVRVEEPGVDQRTVTYEASAPVSTLNATYTDTTAGVIATKVVAKATGLPTGMVLRQTGARAATFTATGGSVGSVEVGYANGEPALLAVDHPYARVLDNGTLKSYAARIDRLGSASFDATTVITGELVLAGDARKPFRALVDLPGGLHVDARVSNLPGHLTFLYDAEGGLMQYDAFGEIIDEITLRAERDAPFFGRVRRIAATIQGLPASATITIRAEGGGVKLETGSPIGSVEALLTSGPDASLPAGERGAQVEDLAPRFTAFVRVDGVRLVDVTTGPGDAIAAHVQLASQPLRVRYLKDGTTVDGRLSPVPSDVTVTFDPDAGRVTYAGNDGIDWIEALVTADAPLFGRVRRIDARVERLPDAVTVAFKPAAGDGIEFTAVPAVGMMRASMTDGVAPPPGLADGNAGVILRDIPSEFVLAARIFEVSGAKVVTQANGNFDASLLTGPLPGGAGLQDLDLDVTFDTEGDAVAEPAHIVGFVQDLPADLKLTLQGSKVVYDADSGVPKVTVDARNLPGGSAGGTLDGGLHNVVGTLLGVPSDFTIRTDTVAGVEAVGPITRADLEVWDHGPQNAAFPEDDRNKVTMSTRDGRLHVQARVFGLQKVLLGMGPTTSVETLFGAAPAPLDVQVDGGTAAEPLDLGVVVTDLPTSSTFTFRDALGLRIGWDGLSAGTDVSLEVSSKDVGADLDITDLPTHVDVCFGGGLLACDPDAPSAFQSGSELWIFPNQLTAVTSADGLIRMSGKVCLPPTDGDGEALDPPGTVYGACLDGTSPNRVEIDDLRLQDARLEFASGDTTNETEGEPAENDLLKLWLDTDSLGIRVDGLTVRNDTSDSTTILRAAHTGGLSLRNSGDHFFLLADMSGIPGTLLRDNQMECSDLEVKVHLPVLGLTDVLPFPGEIVLGDICIDH